MYPYEGTSSGRCMRRKDDMSKIKKIAIIGVGFMGGSLALDLKANFSKTLIFGFARSKKSLNKLRKLRILDKVSMDLAEVVSGADFVVLALPVYPIIEYLKKISPFLKKGAIVFDLGSTKELIEKKAKKILPKGVDFVACHPLCGREKSGAQYSIKKLYKGAICVITSSAKKKSTITVKKIWEKLGSKVMFLSASAHDKVLSSVSHLPHVLSFALTEFILPKQLDFSVSSLRDLTRISDSPPSVWADIFLSNKKNILKDIDSFIATLRKVSKTLKKGNRKDVIRLIERANRKHKIIQA